jgi:hypothetical protein
MYFKPEQATPAPMYLTAANKNIKNITYIIKKEERKRHKK